MKAVRLVKLNTKSLQRSIVATLKVDGSWSEDSQQKWVYFVKKWADRKNLDLATEEGRDEFYQAWSGSYIWAERVE